MQLLLALACKKAATDTLLQVLEAIANSPATELFLESSGLFLTEADFTAAPASSSVSSVVAVAASAAAGQHAAASFVAAAHMAVPSSQAKRAASTAAATATAAAQARKSERQARERLLYSVVIPVALAVAAVYNIPALKRVGQQFVSAVWRVAFDSWRVAEPSVLVA
eukprot:TRINITY_DN712_c0_g1_i1.p1 TRINITY_DN712_c0_g1~~TRINITY_DN712_c0_g1_i1.p1  ORF type:complete len:167 (+),score=67.48 TRINITY_DN712_c0_g1_i1:441-941(+)